MSVKLKKMKVILIHKCYDIYLQCIPLFKQKILPGKIENFVKGDLGNNT